MNVARREVDGYLNPEEPNPHQDFILWIFEEKTPKFYKY
jgi:hypothetical protein